MLHKKSFYDIHQVLGCLICCMLFLSQDNNLGVVKQVVSSMYKRNIQRLTQTYLTLSLEDIANSVELKSSKEAEMHVLQMVCI